MHRTMVARLLILLAMPVWIQWPHPVGAAQHTPLPFGERQQRQPPSPTEEPIVGESSPLTLAGDSGANIDAALKANHGALQRVVILPGAIWSFNAAIGDPRVLNLREVNGVIGGGWCNLATRYVEAAQPFTPLVALRFVRHTPIAPSRRNLVAIWNVDGIPGFADGRRDLEIENRTVDALRFEVVLMSRTPRTIVIRATRAPIAPVVPHRRL